jgi:sucrose-6-phosphate hydrolase SacC (GH32 family)
MTIARPRFHFTPARNWMNDPNGLIWVDGTWHLFFQHNAQANEWGTVSWGHAVSRDLLTWHELPVAIPWLAGEDVYSGSVVNPGDGRLVAVYTANTPHLKQAQCLATSVDGGLTWERFAGNPVLDRDSLEFRDPKVFRHGDRWIMLAVEALERQVLIHSSADLVTWDFESAFGPVGPEELTWECPDLVEVAVEGGGSRWLLLLSATPRVPDAIGSRMAYFVGAFDGHTFVADDARRWEPVDLGSDFYAGVTFGDAPSNPVALAWASNWRYAAAVPTKPWKGAMSWPRELGLRRAEAGHRLTQRVPREVLTASGNWTREASGPRVLDHAFAVPGTSAIFEVAFNVTGMQQLRVDVLGGAVVVTAAEGAISVLRRAHEITGDEVDTTAVIPHGPERITLVVDEYLVEVFADDGAAVWTFQAFATGDAPLAVLTSIGDVAVELLCSLPVR